MKRTAIYIRVSTSMQAQEGDSIPAQRDALMRYIREHHDLVFAGEYLDDGISGTKNDRDEFQRLISDVKAGQIDFAIVTKMDRLHRSLKNFLDMQDIFDKHHVDWLAIWEPMYDSSTPQGRMIINTMMNMAQFEAEQTGQRIRQVFAFKAEQGEAISGKVPYGLKIANKRLVRDAEKADVVSKIFQYYDKTNNLAWTTKYASGIGYARSCKTVKSMLMNEKYIGRFRGKDNYCEPIIDHDLWERVQTGLSRNIKISARTTYLFNGLIVCNDCGRKMAGQTNKARYISYRCMTKRAPDYKCINSKTISEIKLEREIIDYLEQELSKYVFQIEKEMQKPKDNKQKINALTRKIEKLKDLYVNDLISLDEYKSDKEMYLTEIEKLNKQSIKVVDTSEYHKIIDMGIRNVYESLPSKEAKRTMLRSIIKEIRFDHNREMEIIFL